MRTAGRNLAFAVGLRATRLALRVAGFRRTVSFVRRLPVARRAHPAGGVAMEWAAAIERVSTRPYGGTCLDRSVFLWSLMRVRGLNGQLRIGVSVGEDHLDAHAWVEYGGAVVNDDRDIAKSFAVFDEDPTGLVFA